MRDADVQSENPPRWARPDTLWLAAVVALALLLRIVYLLQLGGSPYFAMEIGDAAIHDGWARQMAAGERFSQTR